MSVYPLAGLKVLDFSRVLAGPFATRMLSDLGADVLKVEPPEGDVTRNFGKRDGEMSGFYFQQNIGKRNICLDMKAPGARELIHKLAMEADIVVENYRPGVMDKFGVGWEDLRAVNPKLVMLSISGFGQVGPERNRAAYAGVLHAESGLIARQSNWAEGHAADIHLSIGDTYTALHGLVGVFAALRLVDQTGEGQHIDMAMLNALHVTDDFAHHALDDSMDTLNQNFIWDAPEGKKLFLSGDLRWLWHLFSRDGLKDPTPKGADLKTKIHLRHEALKQHFKSFPTVAALKAKMDEVNVAWGDVRGFGEESHNQPSVEARGIFIEVENDDGSVRRTTQTPYKFSNAKSGITRSSRAPGRGEHNVAALKDWIALDETQISALVETGVLLAEGDD